MPRLVRPTLGSPFQACMYIISLIISSSCSQECSLYGIMTLQTYMYWLRYVHDSTFDRWFVSACSVASASVLRSPPITGLNTMVNSSKYTPPATRAHYPPGCWTPYSPFAYVICNIITPSQTTAIQPPSSSTLGKPRRYAPLIPISALLTCGLAGR